MGLFSRNKKEDGADAKNNFEVPPTLPETIVRGEAVSPQIQQRPSFDEHKRIPEDIVHAPIQDRSRISEVVRVMPERHPLEHDSSPRERTVAEHISVPSPPKLSDNISFFSELERRFVSNKDEFHKYVYDDLIHKMKDFHESMGGGGDFFLHEDDVDDEIRRKIQALKMVEEEWIIRKKEFEASEALLLEKEIQLESRLGDLKNTFGAGEKFRFFQKKAPDHHAFVLVNGHRIYSVQELIYELARMPDEVFSHHVNAERNDFYNWILHVFHDDKLAAHIKGATSRVEMVSLLKSFS